MKNSDINIRDPFVLVRDDAYYLYGTRAADFGRQTGGFDVYTSSDLENWSGPKQCFDSAAFGMNREVNWAPEVHEYGGAYYMFATFTKENGLRGTYILRSDSPEGPFAPHSAGAVTPCDWECLDGTLYVEDGRPYIVFC
nr:family 43 glycosylhydrolase [Clostridia bacterium]